MKTRSISLFFLIAPVIMLAGCSGTDVRGSVEYKTISKAWDVVEAENLELTICGSASLFDSFMQAYLIHDLNQPKELVDTPDMKVAIEAAFADKCS